MYKILEVILPALAVLGVSALINQYDGIFSIFSKLREYRVFRCVVCVAVYVAIPIAYFTGIGIIGYLAIIGIIILLERI